MAPSAPSLLSPALVGLLVCWAASWGVSAQPATLTVAGGNSTATPRQTGANSLDITFNPPVLQVTGVLNLNVVSCGLVPGLPSNAAIVSASLTSAPSSVTVSASKRGQFIGTITLTGISINVSTATFPVNQTDGTYTVAPNPGTVASVARVNGTLAGNNVDVSNLLITFQGETSLPQVAISGSFRPLPPGLLEMTATPNVQLPLNQIVSSVGLGNSAIIQQDIAGGSIQILINLVATGPNPCTF